MNELKKGDFSGIYTRETGKPLFYTGIFDRMTDEDGRPCVFLATDPGNKNTFYRWTQSDLLKRGYYISKTGKNTIPRTAARLHIIFTHSGSLDGVRAVVEKDIYNRWIATTETGEQYMLFADHIRIAGYCIILKTETAEEIESSGMHPYQITYIKKELEAIMAPEESTTNAQEGPTTAGTTATNETPTNEETAPQNATSEPETAERVTDTTCTDKEPQEGTQKVTESAEEIRPQENTTTETTPQSAAESATTTADDTTPTAGDTEPQRVAQTAKTTAGDTTTTPPHTEPPRAAERAAGSVSQSDRRTRPAAPQSHETAKGIQRHHRPPKTAYRATQRAAPIHRRRAATSHQDRQKVTFSAWMYKTGSDPPKIYGYPIFAKDFSKS